MVMEVGAAGISNVALARRLPAAAVTVATPLAPGSTVTVLPEVCVTFVPPKVTLVGTATAI